jgi:G:T-mismatch repair DNA endonuclease (very short patch repair protein)
MDVVSDDERSENMRRIRSQDTKPEMGTHGLQMVWP